VESGKILLDLIDLQRGDVSLAFRQ
jgi:hypothetical protein